MKWYEGSIKKELDYGKPIIAEDYRGHKFLLLPQIEKGSYKVVGYNWFNLTEGRYNSHCTWASVEEAVKAYKGYKIYNVSIHTATT